MCLKTAIRTLIYNEIKYLDGPANARPLQPIDSIEENTDLQQNDAEKHVKHTVEELEPQLSHSSPTFAT